MQQHWLFKEPLCGDIPKRVHCVVYFCIPVHAKSCVSLSCCIRLSKENTRGFTDGAENIVRRNLGRPRWPQAGRGRVLAHYCTTALRGKTKPKRNITMPPTPPPVLMGFHVLVILRQGFKSEGRVKVKREGREGLLVASDSYPVHSVVLLILCISAAAARKTLNCESPLASWPTDRTPPPPPRWLLCMVSPLRVKGGGYRWVKYNVGLPLSQGKKIPTQKTIGEVND